MWRKIKNIYHLFQAVVGNFIYGFPSKKIKVIGVTGTDGKTTTTSLIYHILKVNNKKPAMISTIGACIGDKTYDVGFHVTTPSSFKLQKYIKKAKDSGTKYLVLEVTSHSIDQNRIYGIKFDVGVITNITHEHLDYHKKYEEYVKAKVKLLKLSKTVILNRDDESYNVISKLQLKSQKFLTYGFGKDSDFNLHNFPFRTDLIGEFNQYNILAAVAVCRELGLDDLQIKKGIKSFETPIGRQEIVHEGEFTVMVDFAHTPNAFNKVLPEVKKVGKGRLIHVFGAAGERDVSKRPLMGKESSKFSDVIILTAEDPRGESVDEINKEIKKGIFNFQFSIFNNNQEYNFQKGKKYLFEIPDRSKAIRFAILIAKKGDFVILTGKSHEKSMNYGKGEEVWDEFAEVNKAFSQINK